MKAESYQLKAGIFHAALARDPARHPAFLDEVCVGDRGMLRPFAVRVTRLGICLLVTLAIAAGVQAQTQITTGTIQGTVVDANGAALPGASVELQHVETNFVRSLTTNDEGRFVALTLPPGEYTLTVSKQVSPR